MNDIEKLTELFRKLGADEPESLAGSQIREGIPQLQRFLFLRQAWKKIVRKHDETWISDLRASAATMREDPAGDVAGAVDRLLAQGANKQDLTTVVKAMQWGLLFRFCYLLEDPEDGHLEPEVRDVIWTLFQVNENNEPIEPIECLHEDVQGTAPKDDQEQ